MNEVDIIGFQIMGLWITGAICLYHLIHCFGLIFQPLYRYCFDQNLLEHEIAGFCVLWPFVMPLMCIFIPIKFIRTNFPKASKLTLLLGSFVVFIYLLLSILERLNLFTLPQIIIQ